MVLFESIPQLERFIRRRTIQTEPTTSNVATSKNAVNVRFVCVSYRIDDELCVIFLEFVWLFCADFRSRSIYRFECFTHSFLASVAFLLLLLPHLQQLLAHPHTTRTHLHLVV